MNQSEISIFIMHLHTNNKITFIYFLCLIYFDQMLTDDCEAFAGQIGECGHERTGAVHMSVNTECVEMLNC